MNKRILGGLAVAAMLAGGLALTNSVAHATDEAPVEETPTEAPEAEAPPEAPVEIPEAVLEEVLSRKVLLYDKGGEEHYNLASALQKSVRASDADAALYWLGRMLEAGEDRMFIARRLVRMAVEDVGLADPRAVEQAIACQQTAHFLGIPEGDQALAQITLYLALASKSDAAYQALNAVRAEIRQAVAEPVPLHLRNAPTKLMKGLGYGAGYKHAHQYADAVTGMECLPPSLAGREFYQPNDRGVEKKISERLREIRESKKP